MKILLGFSTPTRGDVEIYGKKNSIEFKSRIGYLPEKVMIHPFLTAFEFLYVCAKLYYLPKKNLKERCKAVLERVGLGDKLSVKVGTFSKGMTQRLGLAQAIIHEPDLLFLDEPGSGLDPLGMIELRNIILEEHKSRNATIFINSHRLLEAEKLCSRIAILHKVVLTNYEKAYAKRLKKLGISEKDLNAVEELPELKVTLPENLITTTGGFSFKVSCTEKKLKLENLHVLVNGVPLYSRYGKPIPGKEFSGDVQLTLPSGNNYIQVHCTNSKALIYEIISGYGFNEKQVEEVIKLAESDSGKYIQSPGENYRIIKHRNWFIISPVITAAAENIVIEESDRQVVFSLGELRIRPGSNLTPPTSKETVLLDAKEIQFPLLLRKRKAGDYFYPLGMKKKKKLNRFLIDEKLSTTEKENVWVLESAQRIIWVVGYRIDERFKITPTTKRALQLVLAPAK